MVPGAPLARLHAASQPPCLLHTLQHVQGWFTRRRRKEKDAELEARVRAELEAAGGAPPAPAAPKPPSATKPPASSAAAALVAEAANEAAAGGGGAAPAAAPATAPAAAAGPSPAEVAAAAAAAAAAADGGKAKEAQQAEEEAPLNEAEQQKLREYEVGGCTLKCLQAVHSVASICQSGMSAAWGADEYEAGGAWRLSCFTAAGVDSTPRGCLMRARAAECCLHCRPCAFSGATCRCRSCWRQPRLSLGRATGRTARRSASNLTMCPSCLVRLVAVAGMAAQLATWGRHAAVVSTHGVAAAKHRAGSTCCPS